MSARGALVAAVCLGVVPLAHGASRLAPVSHFHDLVAGTGVAGFENGEFYRASFHGPLGLAVLEKKAALAVSDRDNDRIRVVWLNENNRVATLAGSGRKGKADGPLQLASFNGPTSLTAVSDHSLVVNDEENHLFRLIDLEKGRVETLAGNGDVGVEAGPARAVPLGNVWNLVYVPAENAIYFSQPDLHALRLLDLASRTIRTVLQDEPRIPRPAALTLFQGTLYVADRDGPAWALQIPVPVGATDPPALESVGYGKQILAMAGSGKRLYALQLEPEPAWVCLSSKLEVPVPSPWGSTPRVPYLRFAVHEPVGFVSDLREGGSFFMASSSFDAVLCLKEYRFQELRDSEGIAGSGLVDFEYPLEKPDLTFRILLLGDSHMNLFEAPVGEASRNATTPLRMATIPKQLELMLNTLASLDGIGVRYEVLSLTRVSWEPLLVWPNYQAAPAVKKFDIDLVLLMLPSATSTVEAYLQRPITANGIPAETIDAEHLLQPLSVRMRGNPAEAFVHRCTTLGFSEHASFEVGEWERCGTSADSPARQELLALMARPLRGIRDSLESSRPDGKTPAFRVCYFGTGPRGAGVRERGFWRQLCQTLNIPWLDLVDPFLVVADTWSPMSTEPGGTHFDDKGHFVFAFVLAHELIDKGIVPFGRRAGAGPAVAIALALLGVAALWTVLRRVGRGRTGGPTEPLPGTPSFREKMPS